MAKEIGAGKARVPKRAIPFKQGLLKLPDSPGDEAYLVASKCRSCGYIAFPPNPICAACFKDGTMEELALSRRGTLYAFTTIMVASPGFEPPYAAGFIDLPEGVRVFSTITGCKADGPELKEGAEMELVTYKIKEDAEGNDIIGYKFRPVTS